jgi:putative peptide zinc metalloprotease protein
VPAPPLELLLPDRTRLPLDRALSIGRAPESSVRLTDATVSRLHARISPARDGTAVLEDAGSSYGTWLDGRRVDAPTPLQEGSRIRLGDLELVVDRARGEDEAGLTVVVPPNASTTMTVGPGESPRVRSGYALKRLAAGEDDRRWVLKDLRSDRFVRMSDADAELFALLDGRATLAELLRQAELRIGAAGPTRLMLLLASLGERGFLADGTGANDDEPAAGRLRRLVTARNFPWAGAPALFEHLYRGGGWLLLRRWVLVGLGVLATAGALVFAALVALRYGTPFVVASKLGIGGIVFLLGRLAVASVHEAAHGLVMASFGRPVKEAGVKLVLVFPYTYVDTSEAWFESRRRRIAVSAAGPASDASLGGAFSLACAVLPPGGVRDVLFQLAFGAYVAAFFNLNPLVERDGYHILVDVLREPGLRRRARAQLRRRLSGGSDASDSPVLMRYAALGAAWSTVGALAGIAVLLRYEPVFARLAPEALVWTVIGAMALALLMPVAAMVLVPLLGGIRRRAG